MSGDTLIRFGRCDVAGPARVYWVESVEHYMWICRECDTESVITWDRYAARRGAIRHNAEKHGKPEHSVGILSGEGEK